MAKTTTHSAVVAIAVDLARAFFRFKGVDGSGAVAVERALRRRDMLPWTAKMPPCRIGLEARASAHHWALRHNELMI